MNLAGRLALFIGGTLFGSAGFKALGSRDAKKVYTEVTAAVLRAKDEVVKNVENVQENCSDILADAKAINEKRAAEARAQFVEDKSKEACCCEGTAEAEAAETADPKEAPENSVKTDAEVTPEA